MTDTRTRSRNGRFLLAALLVAFFATTGQGMTGNATAAVTVTGFSATPSTTRAGGHPNLKVSTLFSEPTTISGIAIHLPAGLRADSRAFPFCSRKRLLLNFCPRNTKVGSLGAVAVAYGLELPVTTSIYNVRPSPTERVRFGVPIVGATGTGVAAELPVRERPADKGLDLALAGLPSEVAGIPVRVTKLELSLKGVARRKVRKRIRKRPFLTNPSSCAPATTGLDVTLHDATALTASSSFTPTGC
jgi:hypothetical protein